MSHVKVIHPGDQDLHTEASQLVPFSSRGLRGNDLGDFVKRAGLKMADTVRNLTFAPGEVALHLIALGATEFYGPNRNGDGFKEATCKEYHDTFVKNARFYRNHQNKDQSKSYGIIKASMYNEPMHRIELIVALNGTKQAAERNGGLLADRELEKLARQDPNWGVSMACARAGTPVKLRRGFKLVEQVVPGDEVLTHRGRYRKVTARQRLVRQQYARISTRYLGRQVLEFTPDHEFYAARWYDVPGFATRKSQTRVQQFQLENRAGLHAYAGWLPCSELRAGDILLMPIDRGDGSSSITTKEARILGYYTAEGSGTADGYCTFTAGIDDDLVTELPELINAKVNVYPHTASDKAVNMVVSDKPLAATIFKRVGRGVRNKVIPREVVDAPSDIKLHFLAAWFNGDGWQDVKGLHWSTCSITLGMELQNLLASVGVPATMCSIDHTSDLPQAAPRRGVGIEYTVNISNRFSGLFARISKATLRNVKAKKTTAFITGDYLAIPVKSVEIIEEPTDVYDLSVEDDESFTACGLSVHNCRVAHDVCSICGNEARTKDEYCKSADAGGNCPGLGCFSKMGAVLSDGRIQFVDNPRPRWFDISDVWKPADRIAYVLGGVEKEASCREKDAEVTAPWSVTLADVPNLRVRDFMKLAGELAELEGTLHSNTGLHSGFAPMVQSKLDALPATAADRASFMHSAVQEKVALSLRDFVLVFYTPNEKRGELLAEQAKHLLPGMYSTLVQEPEQLEELLTKSASRYLPAISGKPEWQRVVSKNAADMSLSLKHHTRRCDRAIVNSVEKTAVFRKACQPEFIKSAGDRVELTKIANEYAVYKLVLLDAIRKNDSDFPLTCQLALTQNHVI